MQHTANTIKNTGEVFKTTCGYWQLDRGGIHCYISGAATKDTVAALICELGEIHDGLDKPVFEIETGGFYRIAAYRDFPPVDALLVAEGENGRLWFWSPGYPESFIICTAKDVSERLPVPPVVGGIYQHSNGYVAERKLEGCHKWMPCGNSPRGDKHLHRLLNDPLDLAGKLLNRYGNATAR